MLFYALVVLKTNFNSIGDRSHANSIMKERMYCNQINNLVFKLKNLNIYANYELLQLWDQLHQVQLEKVPGLHVN